MDIYIISRVSFARYCVFRFPSLLEASVQCDNFTTNTAIFVTATLRGLVDSGHCSLFRALANHHIGKNASRALCLASHAQTNCFPNRTAASPCGVERKDSRAPCTQTHPTPDLTISPHRSPQRFLRSTFPSILTQPLAQPWRSCATPPILFVFTHLEIVEKKERKKSNLWRSCVRGEHGRSATPC